jgi:hypothetical protein
MLPLLDTQVRLVLLNHVAVRLAEANPDELHAAGIENEQLARLRQLSALDLNRLATMRDLNIGVSFDAAELTAGLRTVSLVNEAKALEAYFIRHGASWQMMSALFKIRRKVTLRRRRDCGAWRPSGRYRFPIPSMRERIYRAWHAIEELNPRVRYYRLHQVFPKPLPCCSGGSGARLRGRAMNGRPLIPPGITAELLLDVFDLPISFHRCLVPITGGVTAALMLSQAIWTSEALDPEVGGWFCRSQEEWTEETGLSRWEQETARRSLRTGGFLEERRAGMPAKLWFRVRPEAVVRALQAHANPVRR